jgi:hypothetical protein
VCCLSRVIDVVAGQHDEAIFFLWKGEEKHGGAVSLEVLTLLLDFTTRRFSSGRKKRSTVCCLFRDIDVVAGCTTRRFSSEREKRSTVWCLSWGINVVAGLHDEAVSSGRQKRSTVCCLSRGINVVARLHDEEVLLRKGEVKHWVLSLLRD